MIPIWIWDDSDGYHTLVHILQYRGNFKEKLLLMLSHFSVGLARNLVEPQTNRAHLFSTFIPFLDHSWKCELVKFLSVILKCIEIPWLHI